MTKPIALDGVREMGKKPPPKLSAEEKAALATAKANESLCKAAKNDERAKAEEALCKGASVDFVNEVSFLVPCRRQPFDSYATPS